MPCQPLLSEHRVIYEPGKPGGIRQFRARCGCGWRGHWEEKVKHLDSELRGHLDARHGPR